MYKIETQYTIHQLFVTLFYRWLQIIRGLKCKLFFAKISGFCFLGRRVKVEHAYMIKSGKNLILEDSVFINGLSEYGIVMGDNVSIGKMGILIATAVVSQKGSGITIGNNVGINTLCYIGGQGGVEIGDDVIIGPGVKIFSENHRYSDDNLIRKQGVIRKKTIIKDNCWIGASVIVLSGVTIHEGCVITAGAVVNHDVPPNSIVAGIPAKVLKSRL